MRSTIIILFLTSGISFSSIAQDSLFQNALKDIVAANYDQAYQSLQSCADQYKQQNKGERYALSHLKMAECRIRSNQYQAALIHLENIEKFIKQELFGNTFLLSENKRLKGEIFLYRGKQDEALELLLSAEKAYPENAGLEKAETYNLLGIVYWNNQNRTLALQYHQEALKLRMRLLDDENIKIADSYNNIGLIYLKTEPVQAKIYLNKALRIYEAQLGTLNPKVAFVLLNLAQASSQQFRYKEAERFVLQVEQIWKNLYGDIDHPNIAFTTVISGQLKSSKGDHQQALILQQSALQQYIRLFGPKHPDVANQHQIIGKVYRSMEEFEEAIYSFQEAIYANLESQTFGTIYDNPTIENYFHADYLLSSLMDKASTLEALHLSKTLRQKDLKAAIDTYLLADELINEIRKYRISEADKLLLGTTSRQLYESGCRIAQVLSEQPFQSKVHLPIVFDFIERSKAAVLQQAIQDTKAKSFAGIPSNLLAIEDSIQSQLAFHQQKLAAGEDLNFHKQQVFLFQTAYRNFTNELETKYPKYYELKYNATKINTSQVQALLAPDESLIQYHLGESQLFILYISKHKMNVTSVPVTENLIKNITGLKNSLKYRVGKKAEALSIELFDQLIPKIEKNITKLYLLPDGLLNTLPFEVLKNEKDNQYLIEKYRVSYAFAASLLGDKNESKPNQKKKAALFAPISFNYLNESLPELKATNDELLQLGILFKSMGIKVSSHRKEAAKESTIKSETLSEFEYIHLATHGKVNQSAPELSRLYLKPDSINDGILYSGELYNLEMNANLVALSACETGLGKVAAGEGIVGLSRALLFAGAKNLVVSLWTVSDQATTRLMQQFYQNHLSASNETLDQALRLAKIAMIRSEDYHLPYYWAPFILIGQ
jgi:CHAT domain-containing protein